MALPSTVALDGRAVFGVLFVAFGLIDTSVEAAADRGDVIVKGLGGPVTGKSPRSTYVRCPRRSSIPHHEGSSAEPDLTTGSGGGGGGPPRRPPFAGGLGGDDSVAGAERRVAEVLRLGRPGSAGAPSGSPAADVEPARGPAAKIPLKPPNNRHNLNNIRPKSPAKDKNTVVLPGTDVAGDLDGISAGRARWVEETSRYEINGRTYAVESTGTVFPDSGPGLVNLSRSEYKVLRQLIGADGDVGAARDALRRDPSIGDTDWPAALEVFRHHKSYKGEA